MKLDKFEYKSKTGKYENELKNDIEKEPKIKEYLIFLKNIKIIYIKQMNKIIDF